MISKDIPGGNVQVKNIEGNKITLDIEFRDSPNGWFYWKFKANFPAKGIYEFQFASYPKVGTRGPAVSMDQGKTWNWLSDSLHEDTQGFIFECKAPGEVWFSQCLPYLQEDFEKFAQEYKANKAFQVQELCKSKKGRSVELAIVKEGNPEHAILLTSRHHAQETMGTHAIEGFLRAVLADTEFGKEFRKNYAVYAVPFVDKDGVEDGDQGKGRTPFDHGRDYRVPVPIYPETAAIRQFIDEKRPVFTLDLHCPWIRGGDTNEVSYMVGSASEKHTKGMECFGKILEEESPACAPFFNKNNIHFGTQWNTAENYKNGWTVKHYAQSKDFVRNAQTIEIPFANFGDITVTHESMLEYGAAIARSVAKYLANNP